MANFRRVLAFIHTFAAFGIYIKLNALKSVVVIWFFLLVLLLLHALLVLSTDTRSWKKKLSTSQILF